HAVLTTYAEEAGKKLLFGYAGHAPPRLQQMGFVSHIGTFTPADYEFFSRVYLGPALADRLDYDKIHRFAANLNGYHLKTVALFLRRDEALDTESYIEFLRSQQLVSNVDLEEVQ